MSKDYFQLKLLVLFLMRLSLVYSALLPIQQGIPVVRQLKSNTRESFIFNYSKDTTIQLFVNHGQVIFAADPILTSNALTSNNLPSITLSKKPLSDYVWHSKPISAESIQIMKTKDLHNTFVIAGKLQYKNQKQLLITIEAQTDARFTILAVSADRLFELNPNVNVSYLLMQQDEQIGFKIAPKKANFKLKTFVKQGNVKLLVTQIDQKTGKTNTLFTGVLLPESVRVFDLQVMRQSVANSDSNSNDVVVTFVSESANPVTISVSYWEMFSANRHSRQNQLEYSSMAERAYEWLIGYSIPRGKQAVKIVLIGSILISFLIYICFVFSKLTARRGIRQKDKRFDEDSL